MVLYKVVGSVSLRTFSLSGTLTFAHGAFIALGAYCGGILAKSLALPPVVTHSGRRTVCHGGQRHYRPAFVRLKGMYYSMASMFMGVTVAYIIKAMKITGGYHGLTRIPKLLQNDIACYYVFLAITVVLLIVLYRFEFSRIGTTLRALSQSQDVAVLHRHQRHVLSAAGRGYGQLLRRNCGRGLRSLFHGAQPHQL